MVSLHGSTAEISDAITGAPGTFAATVRGIDELVADAGARAAQLRLLPGEPRGLSALRRLVAARWPSRRHRLLLRRLAHRRRPAHDRADPELHRGHAVAGRRAGAGARRGPRRRRLRFDVRPAALPRAGSERDAFSTSRAAAGRRRRRVRQSRRLRAVRRGAPLLRRSPRLRRALRHRGAAPFLAPYVAAAP